MRSIILLILLMILLSIYNVRHFKNYVLLSSQQNKKNINTIEFEYISNVINTIEPVKEINYFETDKDINNWFVRSDEKNGIGVKRSLENVSEGSSSMQIYWKTSEWAELVLVHFPEDWQNYKYFIFDIFNGNKESTNFEIKIGDRFDYASFYPKANKFVLKTALKPGWNNFKLKIADLKKKIDIAAERKVIHLRFFNKDKVFYLDNMRLEQ